MLSLVLSSASTNVQVKNPLNRANFGIGFMRFEWAVGETGYQGSTSHPSAQPDLPTPTTSLSSESALSRSLITNHHLALSATEGSPIESFLIDTPTIRNASNSFAMNATSLSNRHSSGSLTVPNFASRTTLREVLYLHPKLLCYSPRVTRVPPSGPRESAPARSHGYGVDVSSPRNASFTGAFPHKFNRSTGLIGSAGFALRAICKDGRNQGPLPCQFRSIGFRSPESRVGEKDVEKRR